MQIPLDRNGYNGLADSGRKSACVATMSARRFRERGWDRSHSSLISIRTAVTSLRGLASLGKSAAV